MMGEHMKQKFQVYLCVRTEIEETTLPQNLKMQKVRQKLSDISKVAGIEQSFNALLS